MPIPSYTSPKAITAGTMGGRRGIYGEWIPDGGIQGGLTMGSSYMIGAGGGSQPDTGINSYNRDTFGALSAAPYTPPAPVIDNSFKGTDEEREAFLLDRARYAANAGTGVRYNSLAGIPGTATNNLPGQVPAPWVDDATELARARERRGGLYQLGLSFGGSAGSTNPLLSTPAYTQPSIMPTAAPATTSAAPARGNTFGGTQRAELPYWAKPKGMIGR